MSTARQAGAGQQPCCDVLSVRALRALAHSARIAFAFRSALAVSSLLLPSVFSAARRRLAVAEYSFLRRFFSAQTTLGYAPFRFVRFFARARFHRASSFRTAAFGTVREARNARSKFSNWFGPAQRALRSEIVFACVAGSFFIVYFPL